MDCLFCGNDISSKRKSAKYCNISCSNKHKGFLKIEEQKRHGKYLTCSACGKEKTAGDFSYKIRGDYTSGKKEKCKRCGASEREKKRRDKTWKDAAVKIMLMNAKYRSKKSGIEFNISESDISIPDFCPVFGIELKRESKETWHSAPSIDRIDNTKGYTPDNITVVSRRANILKKDATVKELRQMANFYESLENEHIRSVAKSD